MNKIICPNCNNVNILNNNIKICVFKCPCCGEDVTVNNTCCKEQIKVTKIPDTVYVVKCETDWTEGRGPMKIDKIFLDLEEARKYVKTQKGIMGVSQPLKPYDFSKNGKVNESWNGYEIIEYELIKEQS